MKNIILKHVIFLSAVVLLTACNQNYKLDSTDGGISQLSSNGSVSDAPSSASGPNGSCTSDNCVAVSGDHPHEDPAPPASDDPSSEDDGHSCDHGKPSSEVIECEINSPSNKIILVNDKFVVSHSNSSSNRVCMSSNACLNLINAFANAHNGTLDASQPAASSIQQCTAKFPGNGTCHHASVLSDAQVAAALLK